MTKSDIISILKQYNEEEVFYKTYFENKKNKDLFKNFIDNLDKNKIIENERIVPELFPDKIPNFIKEDNTFKKLSSRCIYLTKHYRYTPLFMHQHNFFELVYVMSGTCEHYINNQKQIFKSGDLCIIAPLVSHGILVEDDSIIINIIIRKNIIENIIFNNLKDKSIISSFFLNNVYSKNEDTYLIFHTSNDKEIMHSVLDMYIEQIKDDEFTNDIIENMFSIFLNNLIRKYKDTVSYPNNFIIKGYNNFNIIKYIFNNYSTITLAELSKKLNYSIPYCSQYIKNITGYTFTQLLKKIKFNKIEILLKESQLTINEISIIVGYQNTENFIRAFKNEYKMTPTQFRKEQKLKKI